MFLFIYCGLLNPVEIFFKLRYNTHAVKPTDLHVQHSETLMMHILNNHNTDQSVKQRTTEDSLDHFKVRTPWPRRYSVDFYRYGFHCLLLTVCKGNYTVFPVLCSTFFNIVFMGFVLLHIAVVYPFIAV